MIAVAPEAAQGPLYLSPRGLYPFQAEAVAYCYHRPDNLVVYDTGIGKSHIAMATAALLFEDDLIDLCLVVAEKNKLDATEWPADFAKFTALSVASYHGTPAKRAKLRASLPQILLSTYETVRNDAAHTVSEARGKRSIRVLRPHLLTEALTGKRVLVIYDEITRLGNRSSGVYKANEILVNTLRRSAETRVMGLTATPISNNVEGYFNLGRIITPSTMPTVAAFASDYVARLDMFGNPTRFKNLNREDAEPGVTPFTERMAGVVLRKRKTDPDVIEQFPRVVEEPPTYVHLSKLHQEFYEAVEGLAEDFDEWGQRQFFTLMRQIAGHPLSLTRSKGQVAQRIAEEVGEAGLAKLGSAKCDRLVADLEPLVKGQGAKVVVFSFFANTVLPFIEAALTGAGYEVAVNAPFLSDAQRSENKLRFRQGSAEVFLTSDAGARGINLPEATYCIEYESALTHANRVQRYNRIHRIDSTAPSVTFRTMVALNTVEDAIIGLALRRNEWSDKLLDDDDPGDAWISAADRKAALKIARNRATR